MNLYMLIYLLWFLSEVVLNRFVRSGKADKKAVDKNTEPYLWISVILSITLGVISAIKFSFPVFADQRFALTGIILLVTGIIIRFIAIRQLGKFFTVDVTIRENHELVQHGFYKYIRHPSYSGGLLSFLGFGISLNNWLSLAIVFLPVLFTFIIRMNLEEKVLEEQFGSQYSDYIKRTKRLIPFIY
jgi:protein-S-isoprenylcysteine O-methyltransferase Ste14